MEFVLGLLYVACAVCLVGSSEDDKDYLQAQKAYETHRDFLLNNIHPISEALLYSDGAQLFYVDEESFIDRVDWLVSVDQISGGAFELMRKDAFFYYRVLDRTLASRLKVFDSSLGVFDEKKLVIGYKSGYAMRAGIKKMLGNVNEPPAQKTNIEESERANVDEGKKCRLREVEINIFLSMSADDYILFPQSAKLNICAGECDWYSVEFDIENNSQLYFLKKMYEYNGNEQMYRKSLCCSPSGSMKSFSIVSLNTETSTVEYHVLKNFSATGCKCT